jgi:hypothetical protein
VDTGTAANWGEAFSDVFGAARTRFLASINPTNKQLRAYPVVFGRLTGYMFRLRAAAC